MTCHLHHAHLFASDIEATLRFYEEYFGGQVAFDAELAGARNVFMTLGTGRIHFYAQSPKHAVRGNIHHIGIQTDDIEGVVARLKAGGVTLRKEIADFGVWKYVMVPGPDDVLIELFQVDKNVMPPELQDYFA